MRTRARLNVFASPEQMAEAAAELVLGQADASIAAGRRFMIALSGGSTPQGLYRALASPSNVQRVAWDSWLIFWSDERCIPPDHVESNYRMAKEALLDLVAVPAAHIHRIRGEDSPETAAEQYDESLRQVFRASLPVFDLILLGLGEDGHTASLFPGTAALDEKRRLVVANWVPQISAHRITFTLPLINAARRVVFLVSEESKAAALQQVLNSNPALAVLPAARVRPASGELHWFVTRDAASLL